ncbi:hypothetical protein CROQUDRAFT_660291 [Cronartium quercuum f. sp. fusiforme G11]|uniref:Uncharacterized protein n=1 Tax=Cronartium quercuum f. sp. fusiforme G11 TaxID=708437 RepID=A0A9P6TA36_9BASI|nr:hypothetical protein CROQUDRAFT_660291 [Cronartium quercuum f. sp. fusiforme G11]
MSDQPQPSASAPKIRHEWYQTDTEVVLSVFVRNTKTEDLTVELSARSLSINYPLASSEGCFALEPLTHEVDVEGSSWKSLSTKIEVKLKKKVPGVKWNAIEGQADNSAPAVATLQPPMTTMTEATSSSSKSYPSSSRRKTNWEALAKTAEKEEQEAISGLKDPNAGGEVALNQLFQKLYGDASDEQKRAMMKSYTESNGTALSTDWNEVKKGKVETKPPASMEVRNWER